MLPYAVDDSTRCLDPPSALACLAAGVPVVSTPLPELDARLGAAGAVHVAAPRDIPAALDIAIASERALPRAAEAFLARTSWDRTCAAMDRLVAEAALARGLARGRERSSPLAP